VNKPPPPPEAETHTDYACRVIPARILYTNSDGRSLGDTTCLVFCYRVADGREFRFVVHPDRLTDMLGNIGRALERVNNGDVPPASLNDPKAVVVHVEKLRGDGKPS